MWKDQLVRLQQSFPEAVRLYQPATAAQILRSEQSLGLKLADLDPDWLDFYRLTNGASILDYCIMGTTASSVENIVDANTRLWDLDLYRWIKEHFVCFLAGSSPGMIGFIRRGQHMRCVAFLGEATDKAALPLASSFGSFIRSFLKDVETVLQSWEPLPGEKWPYGLGDTWPLDLKSWCGQDADLREMLRQGQLDDLYGHDDEYASIVADVLRG